MGSTGDPGRGEEVAGVETTVSGVEQHHHSTQDHLRGESKTSQVSSMNIEIVEKI